MKAVMMLVRPKWCDLIVKREKIVELRKAKPRDRGVYKVYVYETLSRDIHGKIIGCSAVIGYFICRSILPISPDPDKWIYPETYKKVLEDACVSLGEFVEYANGKTVYAWINSDFERYEVPMPLSLFGLTRPPQSICYVPV